MRIRKRSVWQNIRPLLKVSLKKKCPRGLSMISGRSEPIRRSLMSRRFPREVKDNGLTPEGQL